MKILIASNNTYKIQEMSKILSSLRVEVVSYKTILNDTVEVEENGHTFSENAIKKVQAFPELKDIIYLSDDSGLEVEALGGKPGIYSARYAGEGAGYKELCAKILAEMKYLKNRNAQFRCVIAIRFPQNKIQVVEGIVKGQITLSMQGNQGFGYDPIFLPEGYNKTYAEMDSELKNKISHRYLALTKAKEIIANYLTQNRLKIR